LGEVIVAFENRPKREKRGKTSRKNGGREDRVESISREILFPEFWSRSREAFHRKGFKFLHDGRKERE